MIIAADYPSFWNILWTIIVVFAWVAWIWIAIIIFMDIFSRRDISGWIKALWVIFVIVLPFLGVLVYLIANHNGMADRSAERAAGQKKEFDSYVKSVAAEGGGGSSGGAAAEIDRAKQLLDNGTITQEEFDTLKAKALAA